MAQFWVLYIDLPKDHIEVLESKHDQGLKTFSAHELWMSPSWLTMDPACFYVYRDGLIGSIISDQPFVVQGGLHRAFAKECFTGLIPRPARLYDNRDLKVVDDDLVIYKFKEGTSPVDKTRGFMSAEGRRGKTFQPGLFFDHSTWNGCDVFYAGKTFVPVCAERAANFLREMKIPGLILEPVEQYGAYFHEKFKHFRT